MVPRKRDNQENKLGFTYKAAELYFVGTPMSLTHRIKTESELEIQASKDQDTFS